MLRNSFAFLLHCKGTAIFSFCKQKEEEIWQNANFVDLCQGCSIILARFSIFFAKIDLFFCIPLHLVANIFIYVGNAFVLVNNTFAGIELTWNVEVLRLAVSKTCIGIDFL